METVSQQKGLHPSSFTPEGMVMLVNPVHPENALFPIEVTLEGIVMLVRAEQSSKA
jgi:hypothetical protein